MSLQLECASCGSVQTVYDLEGAPTCVVCGALLEDAEIPTAAVANRAFEKKAVTSERSEEALREVQPPAARQRTAVRSVDKGAVDVADPRGAKRAADPAGRSATSSTGGMAYAVFTAALTGVAGFMLWQYLDYSNPLPPPSATARAPRLAAPAAAASTDSVDDAIVVEFTHLARCESCCPGMQVGPAATVHVSGLLMVNSHCGRSSGALQVFANSKLSADGIGVRGGVSLLGGGSVEPEPIVAGRALEDPYDRVPAPMGGDCEFRDTHYSGSSQHLVPGTYCGGLKLDGEGESRLAPGLYTMVGGAFEVADQHRVVGRDVIFYLTRGPEGGGFAALRFRPDVEPALSAPRSGRHRGILFFQDRANPQLVEIGGGFSGGLEGMLYARSAPLVIRGGAKRLAVRSIVDSLLVETDALLVADVAELTR